MTAYKARNAIQEKIQNDFNQEIKSNKKSENEVPFFKREVQNGIYEITEKYSPSEENKKQNLKLKKETKVESIGLNDFLGTPLEDSDVEKFKNELFNKKSKIKIIEKKEEKIVDTPKIENNSQKIEKPEKNEPNQNIKKESIFKQRMRLKKQNK